jgi:hypothetical protein
MEYFKAVSNQFEEVKTERDYSGLLPLALRTLTKALKSFLSSNFLNGLQMQSV